MMIHFLLDNSQEYVEETFEEFQSRYVLFGSMLYEILKNNEPEIFKNLKFYKAVKLLEKNSWGEAETENSYAVYDYNNINFGIQLEPHTEVICLHNEFTQIEIGDWEETDYYQESINFIKSNLLSLKE